MINLASVRAVKQFTRKFAFAICVLSQGMLSATVLFAQEATFGDIGYPGGLKTHVEQISIQQGLGAIGGSSAAAFVQTDGASGGGNRWTPGREHLPTLQKVCSILGYRTYVRSTCLDFERSSRYPNGKCNFHSPDNNDLVRWYPDLGRFKAENANPKYGKTYLATITCRDPVTACSDGKDNDGDGKKDLQDPGCDGPNDTDEKDKPACSDGKDNDGDGKFDLQDPGCDGPNDNDEKDKPACSDGRDNDGDGKIDLQDPGCDGPNDIDEKDRPTCSDGRDNDGDGKVDLQDPGCDGPNDNDEKDKPACSDGRDNDGDGKVDLQDPGCDGPNDNDEKDKPACSDGRDNDGDGKTDLQDPGCDGPNDNDEKDKPACSDGKDNDGDGKTDLQDPGCDGPNDNDEKDKPACSDGKDNDGDGKLDLQDPGCENPNDDDENDPKQQAPKLTPTASCIDKLPNGTYVAHFGYVNDDAKVVTIATGVGNSFSPGVIDRGQPTVFQQGKVENAFTVTFDGNPLQWILGTATVTVSSGYTDCNPTPQAPTCTDTKITDLLIALDSGARFQRDAISKALRQLKKLNPAEKVYATKALQAANDLYNNAWNTTWSIPVEITTCANLNNQCTKANFTTTIATYNGYSSSLKNLSDEIAGKFSKIKKNPAAKKAGAALKKKAAELHEANLKSSAAVPLFDDQCL